MEEPILTKDETTTRRAMLETPDGLSVVAVGSIDLDGVLVSLTHPLMGDAPFLLDLKDEVVGDLVRALKYVIWEAD